MRCKLFADYCLDGWIYQDIRNVICLTCGILLMGCKIVEKLAQAAQEIGTEVGTVRAQRDDQLGRNCVGPFRR